MVCTLAGLGELGMNTGNIGNRIETARVGPAFRVEQTGNKAGIIEVPITLFTDSFASSAANDGSTGAFDERILG